MQAHQLTTLVRTGMVRTRAAHRPAPSLFVYPGLAAKPWWNPADFPWLKHVISGIPDMLREYNELSTKHASDYSLKSDEHILHSGTWNWYSAVTKGKLQHNFQLLCPTTSAILQNIPDLLVDDVPFAYTFFSDLQPKAQIASHFGPCNVRLRVHIPLVVPSNDAAKCGITVGGETRPWEVRTPLVFDDSYEHATWNLTDSSRVILLFDIWHPELSDVERTGLSEMFRHARSQGWLS